MTIGTDPRGTTPLAVTEGGVSVALPTGVITAVTIDGQDVTVSGTTTGTPTGGMCTLTAGSGGAVSQGPSALTLGAGTFTVAFAGIPAGVYSGEVVSLSNAGGSASATGSSAFTIDAISGTPTSTLTVGAAFNGGTYVVRAPVGAAFNGGTYVVGTPVGAAFNGGTYAVAGVPAVQVGAAFNGGTYAVAGTPAVQVGAAFNGGAYAVLPIIVAPSRLLIGSGALQPDMDGTYIMRSGRPTIDADPDSDLYYGIELAGDLSASGTSLTSVVGIPINTRATVVAFVQETRVIARIAIDDGDLIGFTFRFTNTLGETDDRTIYFRKVNK